MTSDGLFRVARAVVWCGLVQLAASAQAAPDAALSSDSFEQDVGAWVVLGEGAEARRASEAAWVRTGRGALDYRYTLGKGRIHTLVRPVSPGSLAAARGLSFAIKPSHLLSLAVSLEEQGGGRWTASLTLPAGRWTEVQLGVDDFVLAQGSDDPPDPNGRLDLAKVRQMSIVDVSAMFAAQSDDTARMFGISPGSRRVAFDDVAFLASAPPHRATTAGRLERFTDGVVHGLTFGATQAAVAREAPLQAPGLNLVYRKAPGAVLSWLLPIAPGSLAGARDVRLQLASRMDAELLLKLEQSDGGKFQASLKVEGDQRLVDHRVPLDRFKRADDSGSDAKKPDPALVNQLVLLDIGGWFAAKGENRLWLQQISASGASPAAAAQAQARPLAGETPGDAVQAVKTPGWSAWTKRTQPIYSGPYSLIGDPSVLKDGDQCRMYYTCFEHRRKGPAICQATSPDGLNWRDVPGKGPVPGLMISARPGQWDDAHETPYAMKYRGEYLLYFVGYRDKGGFAKSFPAFLGLATSSDGVNFKRVSDGPILQPTPRWYDHDAVFSPSIVEHGGELVMVYTGHCWHDCPKGKGVYLLAATSKDGRTWVKKDRPILDKALLTRAKDGAAESEIVKGPDGQYYLFMSLLYGDEQGHEIGVARAASPFGPWEINPEPIVRRAAGQFDDVGPIAPSVLIEGGKVRMWFHGFSKRKTIQIGYAEASWPLRPTK